MDSALVWEYKKLSRFVLKVSKPFWLKLTMARNAYEKTINLVEVLLFGFNWIFK